MKRLFLTHPKEFNLTYSQHLFFALKVAIHCLLAGVVLILHAFFPFIFISTGSGLVSRATKLLEDKSVSLDK